MDLCITERPQYLKDVVGCADTVSKLMSDLNAHKLPHSIMLWGPTGTGKTSIINCLLNELKVDELNRLSFDCGNSVIDDLRDVITSFNYAPIGSDEQVKVYCFEEIHRLTKKSMETLLYPLEHLNENTYIFATTTNPEMLLPQVLNRFTKYKTAPLSNEEMLHQLLRPICDKYGYKIRKQIAYKICDLSMGCSREALRLLQSVANLPVDKQDISELENNVSNVDLMMIYKSLINMEDGYDVIIEALTKLDGTWESKRLGLLALISRNIIQPKDNTSLYRMVILTECLCMPCVDNMPAPLVAGIFNYYRKLN